MTNREMFCFVSGVIIIAGVLFAVVATNSIGVAESPPPAGSARVAVDRPDNNLGPRGSAENISGRAQDAGFIEAAWKAMERFDQKIANTLIFLTVFTAFVPALVVVFEHFKMREIEEFRKDMPVQINRIVRDQLDSERGKHEKMLIGVLSGNIEGITSRQFSAHGLEYVLGWDALLAFLKNEIDGHGKDVLSPQELTRFVEIQRVKQQLIDGGDEDIQAGLSHLVDQLKTCTKITAAQWLRFLVALEANGRIGTWDNRALWGVLVNMLEKKSQLERTDFLR